jgi:hypothetical protein
MIITKKFSSSRSLQAFLEEPETHEQYEITAIYWINNTIRCETKPISTGGEEEEVTH